jgi:hypothetical protein
MRNRKIDYSNFPLNIRLLLAVLWITLMFLYIYGDYFELYVPQKIDSLIRGEGILQSPYQLLAASILLAVPALMITLSLLLPPSSNRLLNIGAGSLLTLVTLAVGISSLSEWRIFYVLYAALETVISAAIVRTAWRWPLK